MPDRCWRSRSPRIIPVIASLMLFGAIIVGGQAYAYHYFYAYGYASCMTCHYNPGGSGPLNDYGRALWSTELSSRWYVPRKISDDELGERSNFFFKKNYHSSLKLYTKLRTLGVWQNVSSENAQRKNFLMQRELGLAASLDQEERKYFILGLTYNDQWGKYRTNGFTPQSSEVSLRVKESYLRLALNDQTWLLLGIQDKPFGIRDANHTLWSRQLVAATQYDQSLGALFYYNSDVQELQIMGFHGNLYENLEARLGGVSALWEWAKHEKWRPGFSLINQKNDTLEIWALATHVRGQIKSAQLNAEWGLVNITQRVSKTSITPQYVVLQYFQRLARGISGLLEGEFYHHSAASASLKEQSRLGAHFLLMVLPRSELRVGIVQSQSKLQTVTVSSQDLMTQWHLAW